MATGKYTLNAESEKQEWVVGSLNDVAVTEGMETAIPDLRTRAGAILQGTVTDAETGKPIPDVNVTCLLAEDYSYQRSYGIGTDADGHFHRRMLPAVAKISIDSPPYGYLKLPRKEGRTVTLQDGKTVTIALKLRKGLTVTGTVVDQYGKPAVGVSVYISIHNDSANREGENDTQVFFTTDEHGRFEVSGLPAGKGTFQPVNPDDRAFEWKVSGPLEIEVPVNKPLAITMTRSMKQMVTGRVVDTQNHPLPGVTATFISYQKGIPIPSEPITAITGKDGYYRLANIADGTRVILVTVTKTGYCRLLTGPLTNGGKMTIPDAVLAACDATVRGTVRDADGKPVADATVVSAEVGVSARAVTDATGAFTLAAQPAVPELHLVAATPTGGGVAVCAEKATDVHITWTPSTIAKPVDLELAQALLAADLKLPREQRRFNRTDTLHLIADYDFELATRLALAGDEPPPPGLRAYLLGKLAEKRPGRRRPRGRGGAGYHRR